MSEYWNGLKTLSEIASVLGLLYALFKFVSSGSLGDAIFAAAPVTGYVALAALTVGGAVYIARLPSWERVKHVLFTFLPFWWAPIAPNGIAIFGLLVLVGGLLVLLITLPETLAAIGRRR
jgi:hypothetical protein